MVELEKRIEELQKENETLRSCLQGVYAYEKEQHDHALKIMKDIQDRDSMAVANTILNMSYYRCSFCEIFDLRKKCGCRESSCTACIHKFLKGYFTS